MYLVFVITNTTNNNNNNNKYLVFCMVVVVLTLYHKAYFASGGYDSDVEREKAMDYGSKTYSNPIRDTATEGKVKPHQQPVGGGDTQRVKVSRSSCFTAKVATKEDKTEVNVSVQ